MPKKTKHSFFSRYTFVYLFILVCISVVWYLWGAPRFFAINDSFFYTAEVASFDNFYDVASGTFSGEQESRTAYYF